MFTLVFAAALSLTPVAAWETVSPESQGVSSAGLKKAVAYLQSAATGRDGVKELLIVRNGRIIHSGPAVERVHGVWSVTTTFTSTVLGLLVGDGKTRLDAKVADVLRDMQRDYADVTSRHLTTMTSGYRAAGDENPIGNYKHGPSRTPYEPAAPLFAPPGSKFVYWDSAMNQFSQYLTRVAGEPIAELFRRRIAEPIGMRDDGWKWGVFGEAGGIPINCGSGNHAMMRMSAVELARLGELFSNGGRWNGKQLISASSVKEATSPQVDSDPVHGRGGYGFNWWTNRTPDNGR